MVPEGTHVSALSICESGEPHRVPLWHREHVSAGRSMIATISVSVGSAPHQPISMFA
jgi:hypothetical protein